MAWVPSTFGAQPEIVLNQLYKHTQLQDSFSMIFLAVANGRPVEMGLVQAVRYFVNHRIDVVRRRTAFLLAKARDREHILEGHQIAQTLIMCHGGIAQTVDQLPQRNQIRDPERTPARGHQNEHVRLDRIGPTHRQRVLPAVTV